MNYFTVKHSSFLFAILILSVVQGFLLAPLTTVWAQDLPDRSAVEREIHVQFAPGTVTLPDGQTRASPQDLTINVPELQEAFQRFGVETAAKTFPEFVPADTIATTRTGEQVRLADMSRIFTLRLPSEAAVERAVERLNELPQVVFAERNGGATPHVLTAGQVNPDDNFFGTSGEQWNLLNTGQNGGTVDADIDAPEAWDITTGSSNTVIGVIDGGVDSGHPDLSGKVAGDTKVSDHGTHVAGIAAAKTDNSKGIAGVDWNAQIYAKAIFGDDDSGLFNDVMDAVQNGNADVLNNSYALCKAGTCNDPKPEPRYSTIVRRAYANAYRMNVVSAMSMGNSGDNRKYYPAGFDQGGIIAVGATNRYDARASFSTTGSHIDVAAPGQNIISTFPAGAYITSSCNDNDYDGYDLCSGTSMAAPHVAGIAGLLLAENPNLYNDDIEHIIRLSAEDVDDPNDSTTGPGFDEGTGAGRVNARKALEYMQSPYAVKHWTAQGGTSVESWNFNGTFYDLPGAPDGYYVGTTHRVRTTVSFPESFSSIEDVWGRGVASTGYTAATTNFSVPYCRVVSHTATSVTLETFVHDVSRTDGSYAGWYPVKPSNIECAYTVLGDPGPPPLEVSLSGPSSLDSGQQGTWDASVSGGSGSTSYDWSYKPAGGYTWYDKSCTGSSCSHTFFGDNESGAMRVTVTKGSETDQATASVYISGSSSDCPPDEICIKAMGKEIAVRNPTVETQAERTAELQWSATSSLPSATFLVQHRTDTTAAWSTLGSVSTSDSVRSDAARSPKYQFQTDQLEIGTHGFRLELQHEGARIHSSPIRASIRLSKAYELAAYPNPVRNQATVELAVKKSQEVRVGLFDILGRRLARIHRGPVPSQETMRFSLDASNIGLTSGPYFVRVQGETFTATRRITVVR